MKRMLVILTALFLAASVQFVLAGILGPTAAQAGCTTDGKAMIDKSPAVRVADSDMQADPSQGSTESGGKSETVEPSNEGTGSQPGNAPGSEGSQGYDIHHPTESGSMPETGEPKEPGTTETPSESTPGSGTHY